MDSWKNSTCVHKRFQSQGHIWSYLDFPRGSDGKASAYNVGDPGSIPGSGRSPGEGNGNPLQYSCLGESHGQRSLAGSLALQRVRCNWATNAFQRLPSRGPSSSVTEMEFSSLDHILPSDSCAILRFTRQTVEGVALFLSSLALKFRPLDQDAGGE